MQHPDEGTIHSWLDEALSAEESAGVESHVAGCEQCKAAVAEARGFIAASTRILTALDDVPGGVIPAAAAAVPAPVRKRDLRVLWRAAAAVLVVAGGSLVVLRDGGQDTLTVRATDSVAAFESAAAPAAPSAANAVAAEDESTAKMKAEAVPPVREARRREPQLAKAADAAAPVVTTSPPGIMLRGGIAPLPLQVLAIERESGVKRTTYQVASGETVTLTETEPVALAGVAAGAVAQSARARAVAPMMMQSAAPSAPLSPPSLADSAARRDSASSALQTINWTEAATGKKLTLTGNVPVERLQEIKLRIERERAAARLRAP